MCKNEHLLDETLCNETTEDFPQYQILIKAIKTKPYANNEQLWSRNAALANAASANESALAIAALTNESAPALKVVNGGYINNTKMKMKKKMKSYKTKKI